MKSSMSTLIVATLWLAVLANLIGGDSAAIRVSNVTLSPTSLAFSTQALGSSTSKIVALQNSGSVTLSRISIAIMGANTRDFSQTHTCGSSLAAGTGCSITVTFKPTASGNRSATLSITDNAADSPQKVSLTGVGTTAKLFPNSLNFGPIAIGTTSPARTVTLTNVGTTVLSIGTIAIAGSDAGDFSQTHTCGSSLAARASCSISVSFKPTALGNRSAALRITDNATGSPQSVSLNGTGAEHKCTPRGMECPPQFPPCCPGLMCVPASTRAFCE